MRFTGVKNGLPDGIHLTVLVLTFYFYGSFPRVHPVRVHAS